MEAGTVRSIESFFLFDEVWNTKGVWNATWFFCTSNICYSISTSGSLTLKNMTELCCSMEPSWKAHWHEKVWIVDFRKFITIFNKLIKLLQILTRFEGIAAELQRSMVLILNSNLINVSNRWRFFFFFGMTCSLILNTAFSGIKSEIRDRVGKTASSNVTETF